MRLTILLFGLIYGLSATAEQYRGVSAFAGLHPKFPFRQFIRLSKCSEAPVFSVLWGTFGRDPGRISRFTDSFPDRPHAVQIHTVNNTCHRNRKCFEGEIWKAYSISQINRGLERGDPTFVEPLRRRMVVIAAAVRAAARPSTLFLLSTGLEDNYTRGAYRRVRSIIGSMDYGDANLRIVRNPEKDETKYNTAGDLVERHKAGNSQRPATATRTINSEDGDFDPRSREFITKHKRSFATILWRGRHQGRRALSERPFPKPRDRTFVIADEKELCDLLRWKTGQT